MKKFISLILVLILTAGLFVGCSSEVPAPTESSVKATETPTESPTEPPTEAKTVSDCISMYEEGSYVNGYDNKTYEYAMPILSIDGEAAEQFNKTIKEKYDSCINDFNTYANFDGSTYYDGYSSTEYIANINDDVLSLVVVFHTTFVDTIDYININIYTGEELSDEQLLDAISLNFEDIKAKVKSSIENYYVEQYGSEFTYSSGNADMLSKTLSDDNIDATHFYLGENKELYAIFDIYYAIQGGQNTATTQIVM